MIQQLRIGNYIQIWDDVNNKWCEHQISSAYDLYQLEKSVFADIKLTEERLVKFGFEKKNHEIGGCSYKKKLDRINDIILVDKGAGLMLFVGDEGINTKWIVFEIELKSVHQLQNLYFALTREELTIKQ